MGGFVVLKAHRIMYLGAKVPSAGDVLERKMPRGINSTKIEQSAFGAN